MKGIDSLAEAREHRGQEIWLPEEDLQPLDENDYYLHRLIGCSVVRKSGERIGRVTGVVLIQGNDLLVVEREGQEVYVPFTASICIRVRLREKEIVIDPPDGLLELNEI